MEIPALVEQTRHAIAETDDLSAALQTFLDLYRTVTVDDCPKEEQADRLLFQWGGPFSWDPEAYAIGLTRQFAIHEDGEWDHYEQLRVTCRYLPAPFRAVESGNVWYEGGPFQEFEEKVLASPVVVRAQDLDALSFDVDFQVV